MAEPVGFNDEFGRPITMSEFAGTANKATMISSG